jgi:hypothetical protein
MSQFFRLTIALLASVLLPCAPALAQVSVISFEDSFFDTTTGASAWRLAGLGSSQGPPSCLLVPTADPGSQGRSNSNVCMGANQGSSDGDGRSFYGDFDIFTTPFEALLASPVSDDLGYDPLADGAIQAVRVRFQLAHAGNNSGTPLNSIEARALVFQRGAGGEARFFASLGDARVESRSDATGFTAFDRLLSARDFGEIGAPTFSGLDAASNPDFEAGAPLYFGFVVDMGYDGFLGGPPSRPFTVRKFLVDEFAFEVDSDADGVGDVTDNCTLDANADQGDADLDGFGNACDGDCTQDGVVGAPDFILMAATSSAPSPSCDLTGDGALGAADFMLMRSRWGHPVGPAAPR